MCFIIWKEDKNRNFFKLYKTYRKKSKGKQKEWRGYKGRGGRW